MENINKKNLILLLVLFVFLIIYVLIMFFSNGGTSNFNHGYILVDDLTAFYCSKDGCTTTDLNKVDYEKRVFKEFADNGEVNDNLTVSYTDRFTISSNNKWIKASQDIVLFQDNLVVEPVSYTKRINITDDDLKVINKVFEKYTFTFDKGEAYVHGVYEIDINNDGVNDKIYHLSDTQKMDLKSLNYEILFGVVGDNVYVLGYSSSLSPTKMYNYTIKSLFRMNNSNDLYVIIRSDGFSLSDDHGVSLKKISNKVVEIASYTTDNKYQEEG